MPFSIDICSIIIPYELQIDRETPFSLSMQTIKSTWPEIAGKDLVFKVGLILVNKYLGFTSFEIEFKCKISHLFILRMFLL